MKKTQFPRAHSKIEFRRHARRTLYVVAGFYVVVGFAAAAASALSGDRLGTFIGFLIISGAIGGAVAMRSLLQVEGCVSTMSEALLEVRDRLGQVERTVDALRTRIIEEAPTAGHSEGVTLLDLSAVGRGDPSVLAAATLDRSVFPRLVASMEEEPPAQCKSEGPDGGVAVAAGIPQAGSAPSTINLLRQWKVALRNSDLAGCRAVYSAIVDTVGAEEAEPLRVQIEQLADRVERSLREAFTAKFREGELGEALALGERLCHLLPDRPIAADFRRIEPHLLRRLEEPTSEALSSAAT